MSLTHSTTIRNALANAIKSAIDAGTTNPNGTLEIGTSAFGTILATLQCANPAFGSASSGTITANAIASAAAVATGTAAVFRFKDRDGNVIFQGTVTATGGGGDLTFSSVGFSTGDTIAVSSYSYSASN